jgi:Tfp pilus assembly protein PilF
MTNNFNIALSFYENGDYATALALFKTVINEEPNNGGAYYYASLCCHALSEELFDTSEAQQYLLELQFYIKKAISLQQSTIELYAFCATLYQEALVDFSAEELRDLAQKVEQADPNNVNITFFKIASYELTSQWHLLIPILEKKIEQKIAEPLVRGYKDLQLADFYSALGYYQNANNDKEDAFLSYEQAVNHTPDNHDILYHAGLFAYQNNNKDKSYEWWSKMYTWQKESNAVDEVGDILFKELATITNPSEALLFCTTEIAIESEYQNDKKQQLYQKLIGFAQTILDKNITGIMANYMLARALSKLNKAQESLVYYEKYLAQVDNDPITLSRYLLRYFNVNKQFPKTNFPQPNGQIAYDYYNAGCLLGEHIESSTITLPQAKERRKYQQNFHSNAIQLFINYFEGQKGSSVNNRSDIFAMCCQNASLVFEDDNINLALLYAETGAKYSQFTENITQLIKLYNKTNQPKKAKIWTEDLKNLQEESALYKDTEEDATTHSIIWDINGALNSAESLVNTHQEKEALQVMENALQKFMALDQDTQKEIEDDYAVFSRLVDQLAKTHKANFGHHALIEQYERGISIMPDSVHLINNLGYIGYHQEEQYDKAIAVYTSGIKLYLNLKPDYEYAYQTMLYNRGTIYKEIKKENQLAFIDIENSHKIVPTFDKCIDLVNLAYDENQMQTAQNYALETEKYIEDGDKATIAWLHGIHGVILKNLNKPADAVPYFEKCFANEPDYAANDFFNNAYKSCLDSNNKSGGFFSKFFK